MGSKNPFYPVIDVSYGLKKAISKMLKSERSLIRPFVVTDQK